jgi:hypothetical protein
MAFVDSPNGGRVILSVSHAIPVVLSADAVVGDLLEASGQGWAPAAGGSALLVSSATAPAGATIQGYRTAAIDFGEACDGVVGDPLYKASSPAGGYAAAGTGVIGRMITPRVADITPTTGGLGPATEAGATAGATGPAPAWEVTAPLTDERTVAEGQTGPVTVARLARLIADLQDRGVLG